MAQILLDGTAETVSIADRLEFIRVLEDGQTPITLIDPQGIKHLVYVSKVTYARPINRLNGLEEPEITVVCVDASDGLWQQPDPMTKIEVTVAYSTTVTAQTNFVWGPAAADTFNWGTGQWM